MKRGFILTPVRDLLKALFTNPRRALSFDTSTFLLCYSIALAIYSVVHAMIVHAVIGWKGFTLGIVRVTISCSLAVAISVPAIFGYYVILPRVKFLDALKRFLFYFISVLLITLLGETFMAKIIVATDLKTQPVLTFCAGILSLELLRRAVRKVSEPILLLTILLVAQIQGYWIVSDAFPYPEFERIASPFIEATKVQGYEGILLVLAVMAFILFITFASRIEVYYTRTKREKRSKTPTPIKTENQTPEKIN